ncbi:hypothetical protein [Bradyrhizobium sp.]|uniref:hypothetical protein n=1 Tax=Bradyrhizobium sp. TaxID=376 RepID=UPI003BB10E71
MISPENHADFEDRTIENVRLQVQRGNFSSEKARQAVEWLYEQDHRYQQRADTKSTLTLAVAICVALMSALAL